MEEIEQVIDELIKTKNICKMEKKDGQIIFLEVKKKEEKCVANEDSRLAFTLSNWTFKNK